MRQARQRRVEEAICGWGQENEEWKSGKIFTPSPLKKTGILPPLSLGRPLPSLKPPALPERQAARPHKQHSSQSIPTNRLKTESFEEAQNSLEPITEPGSPIRLFPSLPMLYSAEHVTIGGTQPALREHAAVDLFNKRFKKYRDLDEGFNFKLLQHRPDQNPAEKGHKKDVANPETFRPRESKPTLKLSTIEIDSNELKKSLLGSQLAEPRRPPKERMLPARSKMSLQGPEEPVGGLKKSKSRLLATFKYEGEFSDQTIFPKLSPSHASPSPPSHLLARPK